VIFSSHMEALIYNAQNHKTNVSFDWPIPIDSVRWELRLHSNYDGSKVTVVSDVAFKRLKLYWYACVGVLESDRYLDFEVLSRIVPSERLTMPRCYNVQQCGSYEAHATLKAGICDSICASVFT